MLFLRVFALNNKLEIIRNDYFLTDYFFCKVDKNKFDFNGRDNQIEGSTSWHDNFANCNNGTIFESSSWSSFWSKNIANVSTWTA